MPKRKKSKWYAVAVGRCPGIYQTWEDCKAQTEKYKSAKFKSFSTKEEAEAFVQQNGVEPKESSVEEPPTKRQRNDASHKISFYVNFDGGSRGNPGVSGAGAQVVVSESIPGRSAAERIVHLRKFLGNEMTNNQAEYHGLILGLEKSSSEIQVFVLQYKKETCEAIIKVRGDSDLIIKQMRGEYEAKSQKLKPLHARALEVIEMMKSLLPVQIEFSHVYRSNNSVADGLANEAMDAKRSWDNVVAQRSGSTDLNAGVDV